MDEIYGVRIRRVSPGDTILPEDHNNKVDILWKIYDKMLEIEERLQKIGV